MQPSTHALPPDDTAVNQPQQKLYGIAERRVDGVATGWRVAINRRGMHIDRHFSAKTYGSLEQAKAAAIAFRDKVNADIAPLTRREACATLKTNNTSGVPGVFRSETHTAPQWVARLYCPHRKKALSQTFAANRHGEERAFELAVEARKRFLAEIEGYRVVHPELKQVFSAAPEAADPTVCRLPHSQETPSNPYTPQREPVVPGVRQVELPYRDPATGKVVMAANWMVEGDDGKGKPKRRYFSVQRYGEKNDAALAHALDIAAPVVSKIRHGRLDVGATLLLRMHEATGISIHELKNLGA